jgi:phosphonate transport system ATP-binding protein
MFRPPLETPIIAESGLRVRGLVKAFVPDVRVIDGIDLMLDGRGMTALIGASGSGKSTLMRCINLLVAPTAGEIRFGGVDLTQLKGAALREARRRIGMVFQEHYLVERLTVLENVLTGRLGYTSTADAWLRRFPDADIAEAHSLIEAIGLAEFIDQRADRLSGGQRQRVGIARAIMQRPDLLLADEPTASLDPKMSAEIMSLLAELAGHRQIPVLVSMHNVPLARRSCSRVIALREGRIAFDGSPDDLDDDTLRRIYGGEDWLQ